MSLPSYSEQLSELRASSAHFTDVVAYRVDVPTDDEPEVVNVLEASTTPRSMLVLNLGPDTVYLGDANVTADQGFPLPIDASTRYTTKGAVYCIAAANETAELAVHGEI